MTIDTFLQLVGLAMGIVAILIGAGALLLPESMSKNYGIAITGTGVGYVVGLGVRDIFIGVVVLMLYFSEAWALVFAVSLSIAGVALVDAAVVWRWGQRKTSLLHFLGALAASLYSMALYFFSGLM